MHESSGKVQYMEDGDGRAFRGGAVGVGARVGVGVGVGSRIRSRPDHWFQSRARVGNILHTWTLHSRDTRQD
jgi:hypothetical protein